LIPKFTIAGDSNIRDALDVKLAFYYRKREWEKEANDAKQRRRHDESAQ
jgi:hypothetical protein